MVNHYDWELDTLIRDGDIDFELQLAKSRDDSRLWIEYYQAKRQDDIYGRIFVIERAVRNCSNSVELWSQYIDLVVELGQSLSCYHNKYQFEMINKIFERSLQNLTNNDEIWIKYLRFLIDKQLHQVSKIRNLFDCCLSNVSTSIHGKIWQLYLQFADSIGGITASNIYKRYLLFEDKKNLDIDNIIEKFKIFNDDIQACKFYQLVLNDPNKYTLSKSLLVLWQEYIDLQFEIGLNKSDSLWDIQFESIVLDAIARFPDQLGKCFLTLTEFLTRRGNFIKARFYYDKGLKSCMTVPDFVMIYNAYVDFELSVLNGFHQNSETIDEFKFRLNYYEMLLSNRSILLNDVRLRNDINDLDVWFDRLQLFKDDLDYNLKTYAMALTRINPIHAHSSSNNINNKFSKLWIDYANVYGSKGDFKTANLVFSKAVTSVFPSIDQLSEVYIKWSEMLLESPEEPEEKAISVIANVLMKPNTKKLDSESKIRESSRLWNFYFELLESLVDNAEESGERISQLIDGFEKCVQMKLATPQMFLNLANTLRSWNLHSKSYTIYERALEVFPDDFINAEIWSTYLKQILDDKLQLDRVLSLFDDCLFSSENRIAGHLCKPIASLYIEFLETNEPGFKLFGILTKVIKRLRDSLDQDSLLKTERDQIYKDKYDLCALLVSKAILLDDINFKREILEDIMNDNQLRLNELIEFSNMFIDLEIKQGSLKRARVLFEHITSLTNPQSNLMKPVWDKWEAFELEHGDENNFKEMIRLKRQLMKEHENDTAFKDSLNPMGFIKSNTVNANVEPSTNSNPDQIDIDMDM